MEEKVLQSRLREARVARLATLDAAGRPHLVPVCFAYDGKAFYAALDLKPKRVPPERLARVRHIQAQPHVALLVDEYQENWEQLWYILVRGHAALLSAAEGREHRAAQRRLKQKYPQYAGGLLPPEAPILRIRPQKIVSWASTGDP